MFGHERFSQGEPVPTPAAALRADTVFRYSPVRVVAAVVAVDEHPLWPGRRRRNAKIITTGRIRQAGKVRAPGASFAAGQPASGPVVFSIHPPHFPLPSPPIPSATQRTNPLYFRRSRRQIVSDKSAILTVLSLLLVAQGFAVGPVLIKLRSLCPVWLFHARRFARIISGL